MTGRDLILYILRNNLEDEPVFKDGKIIGFMTTEEAAEKFGVGLATIKVWITIGWLPGFEFAGELYIPKNATLQ